MSTNVYNAAYFDLKLETTTHTDDLWDVAWYDYYADHKVFRKLNSWQRINQFPCIEFLCNKAYCLRNLMRLQRKFPDQFDFVPETYFLPEDKKILNRIMNRADFKSRWFLVKSLREGRQKQLIKSFPSNRLTDSIMV